MARSALRDATHVRVAAAVAYLGWPGLMMARAWHLRDSHANTALLVAALAAFLVALALVARPLYAPDSGQRVSPMTAVVVGALVLGAEAAVGPYLTSSAVIGHANWVVLASPALLCGLVLRRAFGAATVITVALIAINLTIALTHYPGSLSVRLAAGMMMIGGPLAGLLLPLGPVLAVDERGRLVDTVQARAATETVRAELNNRVRRLDDERRRELSANVRPLLEAAATGQVEPVARGQAVLVARQLRDDLRARPLWTTQVRESTREARERGVGVVASCDRRLDPSHRHVGAVLEEVRSILGHVLPLLASGTTVRCRVTAEPDALVELRGLGPEQLAALPDPVPGAERRVASDAERLLLMVAPAPD